ncbi:three-helix bundle dimerization domain-containing protein [Microbacterium sp. NPDC091313]
MSVTSPRDEYEELVHAADRLARRFPHVPQDAILQAFAEELASFDRIAFRRYVAVLVEGRVLQRLRAAGGDAQGLPRVS